MRKNVYEIFDEFVAAPTKKEKVDVMAKYWSPTLKDILQCAYHPDIKWKIHKLPDSYKKSDTLPGVSYSSLSTEMRRLYMFQEGHPTAEKLTSKKQDELLSSMLDSLEVREAEIVMGIFKKDLGVKGLNYKFIRDNIPGVLP